jgi:ABC-type sugar transport system ATPase subunit
MAQYVFTMNRVGKIVPPKRQILKNINLSFFPGAKIGVLGGNGSGKSTLAKVLSGVLPLDSGQVSVFGQAPTSPHQARALGIATVFQEVLVADPKAVTPASSKLSPGARNSQPAAAEASMAGNQHASAGELRFEWQE